MTEERENWRPVVGYEGLYEISDAGRVRSLLRGTTVKRPDGIRSLIRTGHNGNWRGIMLYKSGVKKTYRVHTLVLTAFVGPRPAGCEVCHRNGVGSDNRLSNLRWGTPGENRDDSMRLRVRCKHGHPLTDDNVLARRDGSQPRRRCKTCARTRGMAYFHRHKEEILLKAKARRRGKLDNRMGA